MKLKYSIILLALIAAAIFWPGTAGKITGYACCRVVERWD